MQKKKKKKSAERTRKVGSKIVDSAVAPWASTWASTSTSTSYLWRISCDLTAFFFVIITYANCVIPIPTFSEFGCTEMTVDQFGYLLLMWSVVSMGCMLYCREVFIFYYLSYLCYLYYFCGNQQQRGGDGTKNKIKKKKSIPLRVSR